MKLFRKYQANIVMCEVLQLKVKIQFCICFFVVLCVNAFFCYVDFYGSQCNEVKLKTFDPTCVCLQMVSKCDICSICRKGTFTYLHILRFLPRIYPPAPTSHLEKSPDPNYSYISYSPTTMKQLGWETLLGGQRCCLSCPQAV